MMYMYTHTSGYFLPSFVTIYPTAVNVFIVSLLLGAVGGKKLYLYALLFFIHKG